MEADVNYMIGKVAAVFQKMHQICPAKTIHTAVKIHLYNAIMMLSMTYARET